MKKKCSTCQKTKPLACFSKNRVKHDGLHQECKDCNKVYADKHRERYKESWSEYYKENRSELNKKNRERRATPKVRAKTNSLYRKRYATEPLFRLSKIIRANAVRVRLSVQNGQTTTKSSRECLGCSLEKFKAHIESQWEEGMSWDNQGYYGWHLDHIVPLDWFVANSDDPWEANRYTNFQPLWWDENLSKGNKII